MVSDFGKRIELLQCERAMTNAKLSKKIGIKPQNMGQLKRVKKPHAKTVYKLASAFNVPVSHFLGFD